MSDEIMRTLGSIEGKLNTYIAACERRETVQDTRLNAHSLRITNVETWQSRVIGIVGGSAFVIGMIAGAIRLLK